MLSTYSHSNPHSCRFWVRAFRRLPETPMIRIDDVVEMIGTSSTGPGSLALNLNSSSNQNLLPRPGELTTPISPSINCTSFLEMVVPSPVPPNFLLMDWSAWVKLSKIDCCSFFVIPMPVSMTSNLSLTRSSSESSEKRFSSIDPLSVNLTALPNKLSSTCRRWIESPLRL